MIVRINDEKNIEADLNRLAKSVTIKRNQLVHECEEISLDVQSLASTLNVIAELEGAVFILRGIANLQERGCDVEEQRNFLVSVLCRGADDSWSGRTNDVRRAMHDGKIEAAKTLLERI